MEKVKVKDRTQILDTRADRQSKSGEYEWYVVNTYSTHEKNVQDNLLKRIESMGLQDYVKRVVVPEEEVRVTDENGIPTDKTRKKIIYSGYVFVEMIMSDYAWYVVRNTPGVTGFIGSSGGGAKPFPVTREQIETVLKRVGVQDEEMFIAYKPGDRVRILNGSFEGTEGTITSVNEEANEVTINAIFFGRETPITAKVTEIDKIKE